MTGFEISLLLIIIGAFGTCVVGATVFAFFIIGKIGDLNIEMSSRVTAIETKMDNWESVAKKFGEKALQIMHSPHTPELDSLIEKVQSGKDVDSDWLRMLQLFTQMEKDMSLPKSERALAWGLVILCKQRLKIPIDPEPHKHTESTK